jgi:hypothetical protein
MTNVFDAAREDFSSEAIINCLKDRGFLILRNLFPEALVDDLNQRCDRVLQSPAMAGANGYFVVDYARKVLNPCTTLGGSILQVLLDVRVLDIVEQLMESDCVLSQAGMRFDRGVGYEYFPLHSDFAAGWKHGSQFVMTQEHMRDPVAIGAMLYLHDTTEGAFCYLDGTHHLMAPKGSEFSDYSRSEQDAFLSKKIRVDGRRGDIVLFDLRGFHGPDQPCKVSRLAIIFHYYRVKTMGFLQHSPFPVFASDLAALSQRQLRVLGVGAGYYYDPQQFMGNRIRSTVAYSLAGRLLENAFRLNHLRKKVKAGLAGLRKSRDR